MTSRRADARQPIDPEWPYPQSYVFRHYSASSRIAKTNPTSLTEFRRRAEKSRAKGYTDYLCARARACRLSAPTRKA
jgi:hypothetical protein